MQTEEQKLASQLTKVLRQPNPTLQAVRVFHRAVLEFTENML